MARFFKIIIIIMLCQNLAYATEPFRFSGSLVLYPLLTLMAENYSEEFNLPAPIVENVGTGPGFKLFCLNKFYSPQVVMASRAIKPSEIELCKQNGISDIQTLEIGADALVIAISLDTPLKLDNISTEGFVKLLTEKNYTRWFDLNVNLSKKAVKIYGPNSNSGGFDMVNDIVKKNTHKNIKLDTYIENGNNQNLIIQKIINDPFGVGLIDLGYYFPNKDKIKILAIDGYEANERDIASAKYAMSRKLILYYDKNKLKTSKSFSRLINYVKNYHNVHRNDFERLGITPFKN